jgi:hypothetical protein
LYKYYRVTNASIRVEFSSESANNPMLVGIVPWSTGTSPGLTGDEVIMIPGCKHAVLGLSTGGSSTKTISMSGVLPWTLSRSNSTSPLDVLFNTRTAFGSNPAPLVEFALFAVAADGTGTSNTVSATIRVCYDAEFSVPFNAFGS